jgi:hypothetical protein
LVPVTSPIGESMANSAVKDLISPPLATVNVPFSVKVPG